MPKLGLLSCVLLFPLFLSSLPAVSEGQVASEPLRLLTEPLPPLSYIEQGQITGFSVELVERLKARLAVTSEIEMLPWARAFNIASHSPNILLFSTALRDSRRSQFDFVGPIATAKIMLYKRTEDQVQPNGVMEAAEFGSLGVYRGSPAERILKQAGVKNFEVSSYPLQSLRQLLAGRVRFWCQVDLTVGRLLTQAGTSEQALTPLTELERIELYLAFSKGTPRATVERWQGALQGFQEDGSFAELYQFWFHLPPESQQSQVLWRLTPEG